LGPDNRHDDLSSLEKQREQDARDFDGSIDFVLNWMAENQMKLEGKIHKPPMISVNMRERGLAAQVEACTTVQQRKVSMISRCCERDIYARPSSARMRTITSGS